MFALVGICGFVACRLLFSESPPLVWGLLLALAFFGLAVDLRLRKARPDGTPQLGWVALFIVWGAVTVVVTSWEPGAVGRELLRLVAPLSLYLLIAHGVQTFRALQTLIAVVVAATLFLAFFGVEQGLAAQGCYKTDEARSIWDGRRCDSRVDCQREEGAEPGVDYGCEHVGLFDIPSMGGRVRYAGTLADPSALAVCVAVGLPLAFGFFARKRTLWRGLFVALALSVAVVCALFTQSRTGQLAMVLGIGVYTLRGFKLRWRYLIPTALLGFLVWELGGRGTSESASAARVQGWYEGWVAFRGSPLFGVGMGRFAEQHLASARSSFLQAAAELGFVGLFLWSVVIFLSVKIPLQALRRLEKWHGPEATAARTWARALLGSWTAMVVGAALLPFAYEELLWIWVGLSGALYSAMRSHDPEFEVRLLS